MQTVLIFGEIGMCCFAVLFYCCCVGRVHSSNRVIFFEVVAAACSVLDFCAVCIV